VPSLILEDPYNNPCKWRYPPDCTDFWWRPPYNWSIPIPIPNTNSITNGIDTSGIENSPVWIHFQVHVTTYSISRALASRGWTKKTIGRIAKSRNANLRDLYLHNTSEFHSYHYVFVDESSYDKRIGFGQMGWSPPRVTPI
jgi:hypothetical protein